MGSRRQPKAPLVAGSGPLARVSPIAAFVVVLAVFGLGVWLRGPVGALLLGLLGLGVLVLLAATWRALTSADRVLRIVVIAVLVAVAVSVLR